MSFNVAGSPFSSIADGVEIRLALALEGGWRARPIRVLPFSPPCKMRICKGLNISPFPPGQQYELTIPKKGVAENDFIQCSEEKRMIASAYVEFSERSTDIQMEYKHTIYMIQFIFT